MLPRRSPRPISRHISFTGDVDFDLGLPTPPFPPPSRTSPPPRPPPPPPPATCVSVFRFPASGTHTRPVIPRLPGSETFRGVQLHSNQYRSAEDFRGARVAVVGAGNSGAQILAEVSYPGIAKSSLWSTLEQPSFLPVGLSGKEIFDSGEALFPAGGGGGPGSGVEGRKGVVCFGRVLCARRCDAVCWVRMLYEEKRRVFRPCFTFVQGRGGS